MQIQCPGPAEVAAMVREAGESGEASFCLSADIRAAHRLFKIRESDWSYLACKCDSNSPVVWANRVGTFGVSSTPYLVVQIDGADWTLLCLCYGHELVHAGYLRG